MEHEGDADANGNWCTWNGPQRLGKETGKIGRQGKNRDYPDYRTVGIGQNTEKSPENLSRLAVTHPPVKDHQPPMV